ncbi:MAG: hypothetical protein ABJA98_27315 [Acidobacteriota bacterium]
MHRMVPQGPQASVLEDAIEYELPFGTIGSLVGRLFVQGRLSGHSNTHPCDGPPAPCGPPDAPTNRGTPIHRPMLFRQATLERIRDGAVTLAFRRWQRPTVRAGGTLLTAIGQLTIGQVDLVDVDEITLAQARKAGYTSVDELLADLGERPGQLYRIELGAVAADPRLALREQAPSPSEAKAILDKLERMDGHAPQPWTLATLELLEARPGVRAGDLAAHLGMERLSFKANVRKLKALGLTISLETGYELAPRGRVILQDLQGGRRRRC